MKIVTASNGKKTLKMSRKEWLNIGKKAGWKVSQIIPDDGYADGGEPYTDEEMDLMSKQDKAKNSELEKALSSKTLIVIKQTQPGMGEGYAIEEFANRNKMKIFNIDMESKQALGDGRLRGTIVNYINIKLNEFKMGLEQSSNGAILIFHFFPNQSNESMHDEMHWGLGATKSFVEQNKSLMQQKNGKIVIITK